MTLRLALVIDGDPSGARKALDDTARAVEQLGARTEAAGDKAASAAKKWDWESREETLKRLGLGLDKVAEATDRVDRAAGQAAPRIDLVGQAAGASAAKFDILKTAMFGLAGGLAAGLGLAGVHALADLTAAAVRQMWRAVSGPEMANAEDAVKRFDGYVKGLKGSFDDAAKAAERLARTSFGRGSALLAGTLAGEDLQSALDAEIARMSARVETLRSMLTMVSPEDIGWLRPLETAEIRLVEIIDKLKAGTFTVGEFREALAGVYFDPAANDNIRKLARELMDASGEAEVLEARLKAVAATLGHIRLDETLRAAGTRVDAEMTPTLGLRMNRKAFSDLDEKLQRQAEQMRREQERAARQAEQAAREAASADRQRSVLADLEAEVAALARTGAEREQALAQLREEKEIRAAIAAMGAQAGEQERARLEVAIRQQHALKEEIKATEKALREQNQAAQAFGSTMASLVQQLIGGGNAGDVLKSLASRVAGNLLTNAFTTMGTSASGPFAMLLTALFGSPRGFSAGGFTGHGPASRIAGVVHGGEYVFDAASTARLGVANLDAIRSGVRGYAGGGFVGTIPAGPATGRLAITVNVNGARGNAEIRQMVAEGVDAGIRRMDAALPVRVAEIIDDPRAR